MASSQATLLDNRPVRRLLQPFQRFAELESTSSTVLLAATVLALALANSPLAAWYEAALATPIGVSLGHFRLLWPVTAWVNDVLMAVFFLVVGLEVKRELLVGELASFRRALLPVLAAAGGMLAPALVYLAYNHTGPAQRGWGVPIATDIAFSLAILTAFGSRIPRALKIFLATLAIADDIGGVLVIAVAYTSHLQLLWLGGAMAVFLLCLGLNWLGVTRLWLYLLMGALIWIALHRSGIHPTLAGILLAIAIPSRSFTPAEHFVEHGHIRLREFHQAHTAEKSSREEKAAHLRELQTGLHLVESPLDRMEAQLHGLVSFGIMPLFALTNAGVSLHGFQLRSMLDPAFAGVALGLVIGKPLGITLFSWLAVRLRWAELPYRVSWGQLHAAAWIAGIGFTVSIFIAGLAFGAGPRYTEARIAILLASTCAALCGAALLAWSSRPGTATNPPHRAPGSLGTQM